MDFGKTKIYFDCTVVFLSILILIISHKNLEGIGVGTLLSALFVERIVFFINKNFKEKVESIIFF